MSAREVRYINRESNKILNMSLTNTGAQSSTTTRFILDPYSSDINPGSESGRKLFLKATEERTDAKRVDVTQGNAKEFLELMTDDAKNFSWGALVHMVLDTDGERRSILRDIRKLSLEGVKIQAMRIWNDSAATYSSTLPTNFTTTAIDPENNVAHQPIFYERSRSTMIAKRILGSITASTRKILFTMKKDFSWMDSTTGE